MDIEVQEQTFAQVEAILNTMEVSVKTAINTLDTTKQPTDDSLIQLRRWNLLQRLKAIGAVVTDFEMAARKEVFGVFFIEPEEGTNTHDLAAGWKLKAVRKINRKLDKATLPDTIKALREAGVNTDKLIEYTPELKIKEFRELTEDALKILSESMTETDGAPELTLVPPKTKV